MAGSSPSALQILFGVSAILGRFFSGLGSFPSVYESVHEPFVLAKDSAQAGRDFSGVIAGAYSGADGLIKGLSEANRIFSPGKKEVGGAVGCCLWLLNWGLACANGVTTGASAFNGVRTFFSFVHHSIATDILGAYFALIVFCSSANFNAREGISLSGLPPFATYEFLSKHIAMASIPVVTNTAFSAYQVSKLLASLGLDDLNPVNWGLAVAMAALSTMSLMLTQVATQKEKFLKAEKQKYPLLSSYEERAIVVNDSIVERRPIGSSRAVINWIGAKFILCSPFVNPFNTPQGLKSIMIAICGIMCAVKQAESNKECVWVNDLLVSLLLLFVGVAIAIPSSVQLYWYRAPKAQALFFAMTAKVSQLRSKCGQSADGPDDAGQTGLLQPLLAKTERGSQKGSGYGSGGSGGPKSDFPTL